MVPLITVNINLTLIESVEEAVTYNANSISLPLWLQVNQTFLHFEFTPVPFEFGEIKYSQANQTYSNYKLLISLIKHE